MILIFIGCLIVGALGQQCPADRRIEGFTCGGGLGSTECPSGSQCLINPVGGPRYCCWEESSPTQAPCEDPLVNNGVFTQCTPGQDSTCPGSCHRCEALGSRGMNMGLCCPQVSRPGCENSSPAQVAFEEARRRILGSRGGTSSQGGDFGSQSSMDTSGFQSGTDMPGSQSSFDTRGLQRGTDMSGSQDSFDTRGFQRGTDMPASQGSFDTRGFQGAPDMLDPQDSRDMRGFSRAPDMQRQQMSAFPSQPRTPEVPMRPMSPCGGVPPTGYCVMAPFPRCPVAQRCVGVGFGRGVCCPLAPMMGMPPGMPPFIPRMSPIGPRDRCPRNAPCVRRGRHECYTDTDCPAPLACCHIGDGCQRRCLPSP